MSSYGAKRRIYPLVGYNPEVVAVAFGKCSRTPDPFDVTIKDLDADKSRRFHEKWIIGYGHSSVAEHAVLSMAIENVSILATKVIEDNRLASYTEKSTRYQQFDKNHYYRPKNILASPLGKLYKETGDYLFDTYEKIVAKMFEFIEKKYPKDEELEEKAYRAKTKNKVFDNCRYMLPIATQTNLGMTVNARQLEYAIIKMLSHPLEEVRQIGKEIKKASFKVTPTLIQYADYNDFIADSNKVLMNLSKKYLKNHATRSGKNDKSQKPVILVKYDKDAENRIIASLLYRHTTLHYGAVEKMVKKLNKKTKEEIIDKTLSKLKKYDRPPRELENTSYIFDILMDYGAFRDVQRHRICTQINQMVTIEHGYSTPDEIVEAGYKKDYESLMEKAAEAFLKISKKYPYEAQYLVPLGYKKRTLMTFNLRELYHFIRLRTAPNGHISYRRIAQEIYKEIKKVHPILAKYIMVDLS